MHTAHSTEQAKLIRAVNAAPNHGATTQFTGIIAPWSNRIHSTRIFYYTKHDDLWNPEVNIAHTVSSIYLEKS